MGLGYEGKLNILAFDHRGSFRKKMGVTGTPTAEELERLRDAKHLIWEGFRLVANSIEGAGVLVDEEMGTAVAIEAKEAGVLLAMPVEKSGQDLFDFEYGEDFGDHITSFDPAFSKVLVRWNPADDNRTQAEPLRRLSDWLHERDRKFLFELLVPATDEQLATVEGDGARYDAEIRPGLMVDAIGEITAAGIEPDIWKIEGLDAREDCTRIAELIRSDGRDDVTAVVLGRGADDAKVDHWLEMGAPVDGYIGFAIGRSIWGPAVEAYGTGVMDREAAAADIGERYRRFYDIYTKAAH